MVRYILCCELINPKVENSCKVWIRFIKGVMSNKNPTKKVNEVTKEERGKLVELLKNFEITITGFRPIDEAIVTAGGISTKEINPKTMESKIINGLYFAGEIIDVDSYTGRI